MSKINVICWSMNRPAQLDLTLESYKRYFKDWKEQKLTIIYKETTDFFKQGYDLVKRYHPEFNWIKETNFRQDTINAFNSNLPYTTFIVDDDVFIDNFSLCDPEFNLFFKSEDIACLSCRIAPYVNFCYTQNKPQHAPKIENGIWNINDGLFDWGYPMSVAAFHVFRTEDISYAMNNGNYRAPNTLEGMLDSHRVNRPKMICYSQCKCITSTINRVQTENNNRHDNLADPSYLNMMFLRGYRLDPCINDKLIYNMCHGPIKLEWKIT